MAGENTAPPVALTDQTAPPVAPTEQSVPYARFAEVNAKFRDAETQAVTMQQSISDLQERLKNVISKEDYEKTVAEITTKSSNTIKGIKVENAITLELIKSGVKRDAEKGIDYTSVLLSQLDKTQFDINEQGVIFGKDGSTLDKMIQDQKMKYPDLFSSIIQGTGKGNIVNPANAIPPGENAKLNRQQLDAMQSSERIKYKRENKDWYKNL